MTIGDPISCKMADHGYLMRYFLEGHLLKTLPWTVFPVRQYFQRLPRGIGTSLLYRIDLESSTFESGLDMATIFDGRLVTADPSYGKHRPSFIPMDKVPSFRSHQSNPVPGKSAYVDISGVAVPEAKKPATLNLPSQGQMFQYMQANDSSSQQATVISQSF